MRGRRKFCEVEAEWWRCRLATSPGLVVGLSGEVPLSTLIIGAGVAGPVVRWVVSSPSTVEDDVAGVASQ